MEPSRQLGPKSPSQDPPGRPRPVAGLLWPSRLHISRRTLLWGAVSSLTPRPPPGSLSGLSLWTCWAFTRPLPVLGTPSHSAPFCGGCLGPQGQVRGQPNRSLGSPAVPPTLAPHVCLRWGGEGAGSKPLCRSTEHLLGSRTPAHGSTGRVGEGHAEPRQADLRAGLPWQRWRGSYYQPPAARGFHWETSRGQVAWTTCGALRRDTEKGTQGGRTRSRDPGPEARRLELSSPMPGPGDGCWARSVSPREAGELAGWRREPETSCGRSAQVHPAQGKARVLC